MKRLLGYDPLTGVATYYEKDDAAGVRRYTHVDVNQTTERVLAVNQQIANTTNGEHMNQKGTVPMHLYASLPPIWQVRFMNKYGKNVYTPEAREPLWRELNDPDNRKLKTTWKKHKA